MQSETPTTWQAKLTAALKQDPKKTLVLGVLSAVMFVIGGRAMLGGNRPAPVAGSIAPLNIGPQAVVLPAAPKPHSASASLRDWLSGPVPPLNRNDFQVKAEYFPLDSAKQQQDLPDGGFWLDLEKSLSLQADQRDKRQNLIENFMAQAAALRPQSTVMGAVPVAMLNGNLVREGDTVASFRVLKIQPRGIVVERDGIRLEIPMQ